MHDEDDIEMGPWRVVANHEEQYSLWPANQVLPAGWHAAGREGSRAECLEQIRALWTDLAPRSLRATTGAAR